jgi:hypothetical protein
MPTFTLILVMFVQYANTSIHVEQTTLLERYKGQSACDDAGRLATLKTISNSVAPVSDMRVGYICVQTGTEKPL